MTPPTITEALRRLGWTQAQLADELSVSTRAVSKWLLFEAGGDGGSAPSPATVRFCWSLLPSPMWRVWHAMFRQYPKRSLAYALVLGCLDRRASWRATDLALEIIGEVESSTIDAIVRNLEADGIVSVDRQEPPSEGYPISIDRDGVERYLEAAARPF